MLYLLKINSICPEFIALQHKLWTVHSVFSKAVNLCFKNGDSEKSETEFISLVFPGSGDGCGRAVVDPGSVPGGSFLNLPLRPGDIMTDGQFNQSVVLDYSKALSWMVKPLETIDIHGSETKSAVWPGGSTHSFSLHLDRLAQSLPALSRWFEKSAFGELQKNRVQDFLSEPTAEKGAALIGLGPGFTPLGDDCLVGVLLAQSLLNQSTSDFYELLGDLFEKTTNFSASILKKALKGNFSQILMDMVIEIQNSETGDDFPAFKKVMDIGASSGSGMLYGFLCKLKYEINREIDEPINKAFRDRIL